MKKILLVLPISALLAAGCNSSNQAYNPTTIPSPVVQSPTVTTVTPQVAASLDSSLAPIPSEYSQGATNINASAQFTPAPPSYIPNGYVLNTKATNLDGMYQYIINSTTDSQKPAFNVTEALILKPTTIQSPLFPSTNNLPTSVDFVNINGNSGYVARNKTNSWSTLVFVKGNEIIETDSYIFTTNDTLVQIAQSIK